MAVNLYLILLILALIFLVLAIAWRVPLWVSVLTIILALLSQILPHGKL